MLDNNNNYVKNIKNAFKIQIPFNCEIKIRSTHIVNEKRISYQAELN